MPPKVHQACVAGSGPKVRPWRSVSSAQVVEDNARLDSGHAAFGVDLQHPRHVPRHVHDDRFVAGLAGQAGAGAPRQEGGPGFGCDAGPPP